MRIDQANSRFRLPLRGQIASNTRRLAFERLEARRVLASLVVTNGDDSGSGSLREAIDFANAMPGEDLIEFLDVKEVRLSTTAFLITDPVTIDGSSHPGGVTITAEDADPDPDVVGDGSRIFFVDEMPAGATPVNLNQLNISGGDTLGSGGGIFSHHDLVLSQVSISNNQANLDGGGVAILDADLAIDRSVFDSNSSDNFGGGIHVRATESHALRIQDSTVSGNSAEGVGGGVYLFAPTLEPVSVEITSTIVEDNQARFGSGMMLDIYGPNASGLVADTVFQNNVAVEHPGYVSSTAALLIGASYQAQFDLRDSLIAGNVATYAAGAGLSATYGAEIHLEDIVVEGNSANNAGGGMSLSTTDGGNILIERSTITGNSADGFGGGIQVRTYDYFSSTITIQDSLISENYASLDGGGIQVQGSGYYPASPFLTISNSTISGNTAGRAAGAISAYQFNWRLALENSTVANNSAGAEAGGIKVWEFADLEMRSSIVADNKSGRDQMPDDLVGNLTAIASLVEHQTSGLPINGPGNILGVDPRLGPLQDNGGPTLTHALTFGSRAVDAGRIFASTPEFDQRTAPFDRIVGNGIDIGAFELQDPAAGDFNGDGIFDCFDINELGLAVAGASTDSTFDLNLDGQLDLDDLAEWLAGAGRVNLPSQNPYLFGDANLDGFVDALDFVIWNENRFTDFGVWCSGDFTADVSIDALDFIVWNEHRFQSSFVTAADDFFDGQEWDGDSIVLPANSPRLAPFANRPAGIEFAIWRDHRRRGDVGVFDSDPGAETADIGLEVLPKAQYGSIEILSSRRSVS